MKLKDPEAFHALGNAYRDGEFGLPQNLKKSLELQFQAAELGSSTSALASIAHAYNSGEGVEKDVDRSIHYLELAAIKGNEGARFNLANTWKYYGQMERAMKHYMIAARGGFDECLKEVGEGYKAGYITKDEYASTLRTYQHSIDEMKSEDRTESNRGKDWYIGT